jgi:glycyl-tRNA synthetase
MAQKNLTDHILFKTFLQENHFIVPSNLAYGGTTGFQDYSVNGLYLKNKLIGLWRKILASESNNIYEIETPTILPHAVLKASGHVDRFTDYVVTNDLGELSGSGTRSSSIPVPGEVFRADHLVKKFFRENGYGDLAEQVDSMTREDLETYINQYHMLKQTHSLTVTAKNLMFGTDIHSNGLDSDKLYLRPEIAQGMFIAYSQVKTFTKTDIGFGICQVGRSYRKEISPVPLTRMREFTQAEIEFFCDPRSKTHPGYASVKDLVIPVYTDVAQASNQSIQWISISDAVESKVISHELIAFFLGKVFNLGMEIGLKKDKIRFRQHMPNEKAHYSTECWDLECLVDGDWLECVGIADRGDYDLTAHSSQGGLTAKRKLSPSVQVYEMRLVPNMKLIGKTFGQNASVINDFVRAQTQESISELRTELGTNGSIRINDLITLNSTMIAVHDVLHVKDYEEYVPHVIEPSVGIDRLLYAVLEQNFYKRPLDEKRTVLSIPHSMSLYNVAIFPLLNKDNLWSVVHSIQTDLVQKSMRCYLDETSTGLGKKYVRADELGIPFAVTVDVDTLTDSKVTIRCRDSMKQIRVDIDFVELVLRNPSNYFIAGAYI